MTKRKGDRYGALLVEMFSIVVAIVLGLAITSWDETRRERARAASAVERIDRELEANLAEVDDRVPYYGRLRATLDSLVEADGDRVFDTYDLSSIPGWQGLRPPLLSTSAFDVAVNAGALEHVDFAEASSATAAYGAIRDLADMVDEVLLASVRGELEATSDVRYTLEILWELSGSASSLIHRALHPSDEDEPDASGGGA